MLASLYKLHFKNHEILGDIDISLINPKTNKPYSIVVFVGENGCGKTTLLTEISKIEGHHYVFLRQNSMFIGLSNESYKLISGKGDLYPIQNKDDLTGGMNVFGLRSNNTANNKAACIELLKSLNDESLIEIYESGKLDNSRCGGEATRVIDGKKDFFDLNTLSSGQQEILLKLKTLKQAQTATDYVLLDEPETSLHPRWQKRIVSLIREIVKDSNGNIPQLFVATHSEKVLESLIGNDDALIIRLFKEDDIVKCKTIEQMDLILPNPTFAELDYVIFKIDSFEYCSQLYDLLEWRTNKHKATKIDKTIMSYPCFKSDKHKKTWINDLNGDKTESIGVYCRNYFHHPKDREVPTQEELHIAIEQLRTVLIDLINK